MKVYFSKLDNGDWICYDEHNTTGDLFVDPAKIKLLQEKLGPIYDTAINNSINQVIEFAMDVDLPHFGQISVLCELWFHRNNICNLKFIGDISDDPIGEFHKQFVLNLDALPAFDPYPYPKEEVVDGDA